MHAIWKKMGGMGREWEGFVHAKFWKICRNSEIKTMVRDLEALRRMRVAPGIDLGVATEIAPEIAPENAPEARFLQKFGNSLLICEA